VRAEEAFDRYHQAVFRFAYRMTRRSDLAEDITQECFLALVRHPDRFDASRGSAKAFLLSIARNLALKTWRDTRETDGLEEDEPFHSRDPRQALELSSAVERAVAALPRLQQEALILFEYEGVTLEEIAEIVNADAGAVKARLHRARERLRRELAPWRARGNHGTVGTR
jgi:RNA polymerase sigma-70 factor (ECF subfamily)